MLQTSIIILGFFLFSFWFCRLSASSSDRRTMSLERKWKKIIISGIETWNSWGNLSPFLLCWTSTSLLFSRSIVRRTNVRWLAVLSSCLLLLSRSLCFYDTSKNHLPVTNFKHKNITPQLSRRRQLVILSLLMGVASISALFGSAGVLGSSQRTSLGLSVKSTNSRKWTPFTNAIVFTFSLVQAGESET